MFLKVEQKTAETTQKKVLSATMTQSLMAAVPFLTLLAALPSGAQKLEIEQQGRIYQQPGHRESLEIERSNPFSVDRLPQRVQTPQLEYPGSDSSQLRVQPGSRPIRVIRGVDSQEMIQVNN